MRRETSRSGRVHAEDAAHAYVTRPISTKPREPRQAEVAGGDREHGGAVRRLVGQLDVGLAAAPARGFGERVREPAVADVVAEAEERRGLPEEADQRASAARLASGALARSTTSPASQRPGTRRTSGTSADAADDRRRRDRPAVGLVVERHVAGDDRDAERLRGLRDPLDRLRELVRDLRLLGIAEVEAVGEPDRLAARAGDVARRAEHRLHAGGERVELAWSRPLQRDRDVRAATGRRRSTAASKPGRRTVREPTSWSYCSKIQVFSARFSALERRCLGAAVSQVSGSRCSISYRGHSSVRSRAGIEPTVSPPCKARSSPVSVTSPIGVHASSQRAHTRATASSICGRTTATIRSCDSEIMISHGSMPSSRSGTRSRWTSMPTPSRAISDERGGEPGRAAVLQRLDEPRLDELDRDLDQLLAGERVADLHGRPLVGVVLAELLAREHGRAADAVAAGRRAVEHDEVARPVRLRATGAASASSRPTHIALTRQLPAYASSKTVAPPTFGTPTQLP